MDKRLVLLCCFILFFFATIVKAAFVHPPIRPTANVAFRWSNNMIYRRRSPRLLQQLSSTVGKDEEVPKRKKRAVVKKTAISKQQKQEAHDATLSLPRTREKQLADMHVMLGIDEAGRGPLAGPVVAAAAMVPSFVEGITDSKKLTKEDMREELYDRIIQSPNVRWAVAVVDAPTIDEINILQATLLAMRMAAELMICGDSGAKHQVVDQASASIKGCYVVCGQTNQDGCAVRKLTPLDTTIKKPFALIDGNRVPQEMPCEADAIVKGDSKEYLIGAASILAKVTRDRLMREYDVLYPEYNLSQHKGYPTAAHMAWVRKMGATPIHRRTFAPLKHMVFDDEGNVIG